MKKIFLLAGCCLGLIHTAAMAKTYLCTDNRGNPLYSEQPNGRNCKAIDEIGGDFVVLPAMPITPSGNSSAQDSQPSRQTPDIQTARRKLNEAKKALEDGKKVRYGNERNYVKYQERIQKLENDVQTRQRELDALQ